MEPLLEKADFEDELLTSEVFFTDYKYHKIFLSTTSEADDEVIQKLMDYLNSSSKYNKIKAVVVEEAKDQIIEINKTVQGINDIVNSISQSPSFNSRSEDIYIYTGNDIDIAKLVENKTSILRNRERIRTEIIKYDDIVTVMNNPSLHDKDKLLPLEQTTIPLYFIVAFLMYSYLKHQYKKDKKLADSKNSEF